MTNITKQEKAIREMVKFFIPPLEKGTYTLVLHLDKEKRFRVGRLGVRLFCAGYYAYIGSALGPGGLTARLKHHMNISRSPRWHIDYLRREAVPKEAWVLEQGSRCEHLWADAVARRDATADPVPRFGCSDCRCPTHLFHFKRRPGFHRFESMIRKWVPDHGPVRRIRFDI